jgi:hypothetical protein
LYGKRQNNRACRYGGGFATAAVFIVIFISAAAGSSAPPIILPPIPDESDPGTGGSISDPGVSAGPDVLIEITPENFKTVLGKLKRPDSYSEDITIELFWTDGESSVIRKGWFLGSFARWQYYDADGKPVINCITGDAMTYTWEEGSDSYVSSPDAGILSDDLGQIPTYEDILSYDSKDVSSASYEDADGEPCIKVAVDDKHNGVIRYFWVSIDKGVLWRAEIEENGKTTYIMSVIPESFSGNAPDKNVFLLPDGSDTLGGEG